MNLMPLKPRMIGIALFVGVWLVVASPPLLDAQTDAPHVVFIEEPQELAMSSVTDPGPDGVARLADLFREQGALVEWIRLRDTIPQDVDVIVLVRRRRGLSAENLSRVWMQVGAGASLLVAIDPDGYLNSRTEQENGGLSTLTTQEEGVTLLNGIILEPWYTNETLKNLRATLSIALPDTVPHPVIDPLQHYDLALMLWGARPVRAEPFGVDSLAWSLAMTEPLYAETNTNIFPSQSEPGAPFELNIGKDRQGRLSVVGIGENTRSGSRIAVLGDAELLQNDFGLAVDGAGNPLFPGDYILAQRIASWLMRRDTFPDLPDNVLWLGVDGQPDDWTIAAGAKPDDSSDTSVLGLDITQFHGVRTDSYAYVMLETAQDPPESLTMTVEYDLNRDGELDGIITLTEAGVTLQRGTDAPVLVSDAAFATGTVVEARIPLRLVNLVTAITRICLAGGTNLVAQPEPDCVSAALPIPLSLKEDAAPLRVSFGTPLATVSTDGVNRANVRATPDASGTLVASLPLHSIIGLIGRTADSRWFYVQTGGAEGWVNALSLSYIGDVESIPVRS